MTTPHRGGVLQIWTLDGNGKLEEIADTDDVSNHVMGSVHLGLSVVADFDGDGIADIALPSRDRRSLRFLSLKKGEIIELSRVGLPAPASENFSLVVRDGRKAVSVGLAGGRAVIVEP